MRNMTSRHGDQLLVISLHKLTKILTLLVEVFNMIPLIPIQSTVEQNFFVWALAGMINHHFAMIGIVLLIRNSSYCENEK